MAPGKVVEQDLSCCTAAPRDYNPATTRTTKGTGDFMTEILFADPALEQKPILCQTPCKGITRRTRVEGKSLQPPGGGRKDESNPQQQSPTQSLGAAAVLQQYCVIYYLYII